MEWYPKRIKCPKCGKYAQFSRLVEGIPEYKCRCGEVIRWIMGKKFRKIPLPIKAKYGNYYAVFKREPIPPFWRGTLGVYQDSNNNIWYQAEWKVTFVPKTRLFRLYVDGKPIMVKEAMVE